MRRICAVLARLHRTSRTFRGPRALFLLFVAGYWTQSFVHTYKDEDDLLQCLRPRRSGPGTRPIYGATLEAEVAARAFEGGRVWLRTPSPASRS